MCTIHTYSSLFYVTHTEAIQQQIRQDALSNDDGISMVFLDGHAETTNSVYRTMDIDGALGVLGMWMSEATEHARVWVHLRAATTANKGVAYTHAFDDLSGVLYMHNGILGNQRGWSVDSFQMTSWKGTTGKGLLNNLLNRKEYFANVFRIDTENYEWSVTRMDSGSLHTDGEGNYSTRSYSLLTQPVATRTSQSYKLNYLVLVLPVYAGYYGGGSSYVGGYKPLGSSSSTYWVGAKWDRVLQEWCTEEELDRRREIRAGTHTSGTPATAQLPTGTTTALTVVPPTVLGPEPEEESTPEVSDTPEFESDESTYDRTAFEEWLRKNAAATHQEYLRRKGA